MKIITTDSYTAYSSLSIQIGTMRKFYWLLDKCDW